MAHDWSTDPRPLADCLRAWAVAHGHTRGGAAWVSKQLRVQERTVQDWLQGRRFPPLEALVRRCMDLIDERQGTRPPAAH